MDGLRIPVAEAPPDDARAGPGLRGREHRAARPPKPLAQPQPPAYTRPYDRSVLIFVTHTGLLIAEEAGSLDALVSAPPGTSKGDWCTPARPWW